MPFTDRQVNALRPKKARYEVPEPGRTGLSIRVTPHGGKTWAFRYRFGGRQRRLVLGEYPNLGVADAHLKLAEAKRKLAAGLDPGIDAAVPARRVQHNCTVDDVVQRYAVHARKTMRPATAKEDLRILAVEVLPLWRGRLVKEITRTDVMELLKGIEDRGVYVMRNRVAGLLSRFFLFALDEGLIDASPAIKLRRLRKVHGQRVEKARGNFLTEDQIRAFWQNVDTIPVTRALRAALKWLLVTGQRRGEVAGALRAEIDDAALWTIPATRTKNEREQRLPLPELALQVLREADAARVRPQPTRLNRKDRKPYDPSPSPWLFPSNRHGKPITPGALTCAVVRHRQALGIGNATVHDIRRSVATWMGELGIEKSLIAAVLNHAPKGVTDVHYNHAVLLESKRKAMDRWSPWLKQVIAGQSTRGNAVDLRPPVSTTSP